MKKKLKDKRILITAGPTYEPIDPVRYIGNYSSGKMGYALAAACAKEGARVILISGPVSLEPGPTSIQIIRVNTASEMYNACMDHFQNMDIAILTAAVADFTPESPELSKIKREKDKLNLILVPTKDIAAELGKRKTKTQILVGFALETDNELENAQSKLSRKNLDIIVLNSLKDAGAGFGTDTNKVTIIDKNNIIDKFELKSKDEVASDIIDSILRFI